MPRRIAHPTPSRPHAINRRRFLQFTGSALAAVGLSQLDILNQAQQHHRVLAQNTPRKLALLVGINDYPFVGMDLNGCLTDVDLQYELLVHRYGFNPADIVKISDAERLKPNRDTIIQTFREHLIAQARPGDVVVFHYSGHGSRVVDPNPIYSENNLNGTIVTNDPIPQTVLDEAQRTGELVVPDIMGRTLFLLMRSLRTENVTVVLDSCHSGGGLRGNNRVRAADRLSDRVGGTSIEFKPSDADLALQETLLANLDDYSFKQFQSDREKGIAKGIGIGSAQFSQQAIDMTFDGFYAGAFTYLLTRYLWQMPGSTPTNTVQVNLERSTRAATDSRNRVQVPEFLSAPERDHKDQPIYFTDPVTGSADAVVTSVNNQQIGFWLGGASAQFLESAEGGAIFTVLDRQGQPVGELEYMSHSGLGGVGRPIEGEISPANFAIQPGMLLREKLVGLPPNPKLRIGVDPSLGDDVEVAITELNTALLAEQTGQSRIKASAFDKPATFDYVIGRMTEEYAEQLREDFGDITLPPIGAIALFSPVLEPIASTDGRIDEMVPRAVSRLKPKFKSLLANKVLSLLASTTSSLPVQGEIFATTRSDVRVPIATGETLVQTSIEPFRAGETLKIRMMNNHSEPLHMSCIVITEDGDMTVIYPADWVASDDATLIAPGEELIMPRPQDLVEFKVSGTGYLEILTLMSTGSLRNALRGLQDIAVDRGEERTFLPLDGDESLGVLEDLLGDIDGLSRGGDRASFSVNRIDQENTAVDGGAIATFSTVIEIAEIPDS
ncbi:MAG: caspase family protein [Cyanobacteria bacterium P01_F01_bin.150]